MPHRGDTSSTYLFHSRDLILLLLTISVCTADIKMLAKEAASLAVVSFHIVGLHVREVSVFGKKKSEAVCGFLAYFCAVF